MKTFLKFSAGIIIILLISVSLGLTYAIKHILPYSPIRPSRCNPTTVTPSSAGLSWEDFDVTVEDTIRLKGWFVRSKSVPARGTIFLLHGIGSCKASMAPMAKLFAEHGYNSVLYDSRANGESGGINCTFGYYEKRDASTYLDSVIARFPHTGPYGIYGHSLGAAVAIQTLADDKRFTCGIAESTFANLRDVIHDYFARMIFIHIDGILDRALKYTEQIAQFKIDSVQPRLSALRITQPTMIIHGLKDQNISSQYGKQIFDNLASIHKQWYPIPNGSHNNLRSIGGKEYEKNIILFFNTYLATSSN
jgi:uncharacterized protein